MTISLKHGHPKIWLTDSHFLLSFGWNLKESAKDIQTDCAIFLLDSNGKVASDDDLIFYNNPAHGSRCIEHLGIPNVSDNVEQFKVDLSKIPARVSRIQFVAAIYEAESRKQNFSMIKDAYFILDDLDSKQKLRRIDFDPTNSNHTIEIGEIYRFKGIWRFRETWIGYSGGLEGACRKFGMSVEDSPSTGFSAQTSGNDYWSIFKKPENINTPKKFEDLGIGTHQSNESGLQGFGSYVFATFYNKKDQSWHGWIELNYIKFDQLSNDIEKIAIIAKPSSQVNFYYSNYYTCASIVGIYVRDVCYWYQYEYNQPFIGGLDEIRNFFGV
ncbi:MAG: TerD family protein [Selenomonadaceae bacterium]|nr:TerD family protein [Selenomonadaceae bacterium]